MAGRLCFVFLCSLIARVYLASPCDDVSTLPNDGLRYKFNKITSSYVYFNDAFVNESAWYRSCEKMLDEPPEDMYMCATKYPIWLNGSHPTSSEAVTKQACMKSFPDPCAVSYTIQIAKCDDCFVYKLKRTYHTSSYCFGIGTDGERPRFQPTKPAVKPDLSTTYKGSEESDPTTTTVYPTTKTVFICEFEIPVDETLQYMVHWYEHGEWKYNTILGHNHTEEQLFITEEVFVEKGFTMGSELSCEITAFAFANGPCSKRSERSENLFIGIKILTPAIDLSYGESGVIRLQPVTPIGCFHAASCDFRLVSYTPSKEIRGECQTLAFTAVDFECGIIITNDMTKEYSIGVTNNDNGQIRGVETDNYKIFLYITTNDNKIWGNYELPPIPVTITYGPSENIKSIECSVINDPHISTFDKREYDDHDSSYTLDEASIMYLNTFYDTEVQIAYSQCNYLDHIRCVCGVAVRAGHDVFVKNICGGVQLFGYKYCSENERSLTVKANDDMNIRINFKYGTYVRVEQENRYGGTFLRVYITPSPNDKNHTRGLCGTFDDNADNDFHMSDGRAMPPSYHSGLPSGYGSNPVDFTGQWRVSLSKNLFFEDFDTSNLTPDTQKVCMCDKNESDAGGTPNDLLNVIPCTQNGATLCTQGTVLPAEHCLDISTNRRRRAFRTQRVVPIVKANNLLKSDTRKKRQTTEWTETEASDYCDSQFQASPIYDRCRQVPAVDPRQMLEVCKVDIQLTNGTDWVESAVDAFGSACVEQLWRNVSLVREIASGAPMYESILDDRCPGDCLDRGTCEKGTCICEDGAGGADCSVDTTIAPSMSGLLDGGLCDSSEHDCLEKIFVFGGYYVDSANLLCKIRAFKDNELGNRTYDDEHTLKPQFITYAEVLLSLAALRRKRSTTAGAESRFISGYTISVTNNGQTYSETTDLFVYDSECQLVQDTSGTFRFTLKEGFCYIDDMCVINGLANAEDNCYFCNSSSEPNEWTLNVSKAGCEIKVSPTKEDGTGEVAIIAGSVVGGLVLLGIVIIGIALLLKKFKSKVVVGNSTMFDSAIMDRAYVNTRPVVNREELYFEGFSM